VEPSPLLTYLLRGTKLVGVASSKQLPLAPIDEKEIELEKSKEDFDPVS